MNDDRPVIVAYDGSPEAQVALREAAALFRDRSLLVVTVWEPGLAALAFASPAGDPGMPYLPPDPVQIDALDEAERDHAKEVAEAGAQLARELGATVIPVAIAEEANNIAETVAGVAEQRDACVVVVGSRGLGGVKRHILGSTTQRLLRGGHPPVLVVRAP